MQTRITDNHHDLQGQRSRWRCHVVRQIVVDPQVENEKSHKHKIGRKGVQPFYTNFAHPTANNVHQFQGQKVKCQGHQAN